MYEVDTRNVTLMKHRPTRRGRRALIVDRDSSHCAHLLTHLSNRGFTVLIAHGWFEALSLMGTDAPELAIFQRDGVDGECDRAVALAKMLHPETRIIQTWEDAPKGEPSREPDVTPILARPVDTALFDCCLIDMELASA